ncbi:MAG: P1 family peptidase [Acidobacteriia bacterium]|nr:P1 family peptidase [Terriglobia bacterium]
MSKPGQQLIPGLTLGHYTHPQARTGCTVLVCEAGAVAGVDIRGSASGTREIEPLRPDHLVDRVHAVGIAGGSAFGLAAADGVMEYLEQHGVGFDVGVTRVPIVSAAIIFDLGVGSPWIRPDRQAGYSAAASARGDRVEQGRVGAGTGATVGKLLGSACASPGGFGFSSLKFSAPQDAKARGAKQTKKTQEITIQAFAVVNAFGDVFNPQKRKIIAGARRSPSSRIFADTYTLMKRGIIRSEFKSARSGDSSRSAAKRSPLSATARESLQRMARQMPPAVRKMFEREGADTGSRFNMQNTTVVVVATDAQFNKIQMQKIAQMAQNGVARTIRPAHTLFDGDTVFALSVPDPKHPLQADVNAAGEVAAEAVAKAVVAAVKLTR